MNEENCKEENADPRQSKLGENNDLQPGEKDPAAEWLLRPSRFRLQLVSDPSELTPEVVEALDSLLDKLGRRAVSDVQHPKNGCANYCWVDYCTGDRGCRRYTD